MGLRADGGVELLAELGVGFRAELGSRVKSLFVGGAKCRVVFCAVSKGLV